MSNSYSVSANDYNKKPNYSLIAAASGAVIGAGSGAYYGAKHNFYTEKGGALKDSFAKSVEKVYMETADPSEKNLFNQLKEIGEKIKKIKNPTDLKALIESNPIAKSKISTKYIVDEKDLKESINNIEKEVKVQRDALRFNAITSKLSWDNKTKNFIEPADTKLKDALSKAQSKVKNIKMAKFAGIGAVSVGILAYLTKSLISSDKNVQ